MARYTKIAPVYDLLAAEWPVYRVGRRLAVPLLQLGPGDTVVDVGCGTGLNFSLLAKVVGPGCVVGTDSSPDMLRAASRKVPRLEADTGCHIRLNRADATTMGNVRCEVHALQRGADALLFTYSLSVMRPWRRAWEQALTLARPGTRVAVVDMTTPSGAARLLSPLARLACELGGSDINAHPWQALDTDCVDVTHEEVWGGHVQVWAGTVPSTSVLGRGPGTLTETTGKRRGCVHRD